MKKSIKNQDGTKRADATPAGLEVVEGSVWCDVHGCVHDKTTDPYSSGYEISGEEPECNEEYWRTLYMKPLPE